MISKDIIKLHANFIELLKDKKQIMFPSLEPKVDAKPMQTVDYIRKLINISTEEWEGSMSTSNNKLVECAESIIKALEQLVFSNKKFREDTMENIL